MKKLAYIIIAASLLLTACAKNEVKEDASARQISFLAANYATKAGVTGTVFPTTESFGAYAWADGTDGTYFMDNEVVSFQDPLWVPSTTYYWPKYATVDFFCFYPTTLSGVMTVGENQIDIAGYDTSAQEDVMYADKAVGFADNQDLVSDAVNGYTGVPAFFRHALAKVKVNIYLPYESKTEADGTTYNWTVKVKNFNLTGVYGKGDCTLTLSDPSATGIVPWNKPASNVWTNDGTTTSMANATEVTLAPATPYTALDETFVLPQELVAGQQQLSLDIRIETVRNGAAFLTENVTRTVDLYLASLPAWEINHEIIYTITLAPTASNGNGGNPYNPSDPSDPGIPDPNDPDLSDAVITFDPAVDGWESVTVEANLAI